MSIGDMRLIEEVIRVMAIMLTIKTTLRLPVELQRFLVSAAKSADRSLNLESLERLKHSRRYVVPSVSEKLSTLSVRLRALTCIDSSPET